LAGEPVGDEIDGFQKIAGTFPTINVWLRSTAIVSIDWLSCQWHDTHIADVSVSGHLWPMALKNRPAARIPFDLPARLPACGLEPKVEAADTSEQRTERQVMRPTG